MGFDILTILGNMFSIINLLLVAGGTVMGIIFERCRDLLPPWVLQYYCLLLWYECHFSSDAFRRSVRWRNVWWFYFSYSYKYAGNSRCCGYYIGWLSNVQAGPGRGGIEGIGIRLIFRWYFWSNCAVVFCASSGENISKVWSSGILDAGDFGLTIIASLSESQYLRFNCRYVGALDKHNWHGSSLWNAKVYYGSFQPY